MTTILLVDDSTSIRNMPCLDGLGVLKAIRSGTANRKLPIPVLSTENSEQMKTAFPTSGANGWIAKPFTPERLEAALNKFPGN